MAKENSGSMMAVLSHTLVSSEFYKPSQGRRVRSITGLATAGVFLVAAYQILVGWSGTGWGAAGTVLALLLGCAGSWVAFRLVCWPPFADFLIQTEAEMNKVSWPTETEVIRGSGVVLFTMFFLAAMLFLYDYALFFVLWAIGIK